MRLGEAALNKRGNERQPLKASSQMSVTKGSVFIGDVKSNIEGTVRNYLGLKNKKYLETDYLLTKLKF